MCRSKKGNIINLTATAIKINCKEMKARVKECKCANHFSIYIFFGDLYILYRLNIDHIQGEINLVRRAEKDGVVERTTSSIAHPRIFTVIFKFHLHRGMCR